MNILSFVHAYPPDHNAGAEYMLHTINKYMVSKGHKCTVMTRGGDAATIKNGKVEFRKLYPRDEFEGVRISREGVTMYNKVFNDADIVITHLDRTGKAINLCKSFQKPLIHLIHNTHYNDVIVKINSQNAAVVYNNEWVKEKLNYPLRNYILHPPVNHKDYEVKVTGKAITLINCFFSKGGKMLVELAKRFPHRKFIGVMGYGDQVLGDLKNLTYVENTPNIKAIYKQSRIILMPSSYESYGRVAIEACASGIPVIASSTPGLKASLDYAGVFAKKWDDPDEWERLVRSLDDEEYYKKVSALGRKRAKEMTEKGLSELEGLEKFFETIKQKPYVV